MRGHPASWVHSPLLLHHTRRTDFYHRWAVTTRGVWGCCLGSNARWSNGAACSQYNSAETLCRNAGENANVWT